MRRSSFGSRGMHDHQVIGAKILPFPPGGRHNRRPGRLWDSLALLPLLDSPVTLLNGLSKLSHGIPVAKNIIDIGGLHTPDTATDELSVQGRTDHPVTRKGRKRTICPMGRGKTDADFLDEFCERTRSARITAGFNDLKEFALLMGIAPDTYLRYETRTPLPHRYIPKFLRLTGVSADVLFTGRRIEQRKIG